MNPSEDQENLKTATTPVPESETQTEPLSSVRYNAPQIQRDVHIPIRPQPTIPPSPVSSHDSTQPVTIDSPLVSIPDHTVDPEIAFTPTSVEMPGSSPIQTPPTELEVASPNTDAPHPEAPFNPFTSAPIASTSQLSKPKTKSPILRYALLAIAALLIVTLPVYFWLLPQYWNSTYSTTAGNAYDKQATQMLAVYGSFHAPVFTSKDTTQQADTKDLADANTAIKAAVTSTADLTAKNQHTVLPGTLWSGSTAQTDQQHKAMQLYVQHSQAFLVEYQALITYMSSFEQIDTTQLPAVTTDLGAIGSAQSLPQLSTTSQTASHTLNGLINSINALQPPTDLHQFNSTLVQDLTAINTALQGIINGVSNQSVSQVQISLLQLAQAGNTLDAYSSTDIASMLQNNSSISKHIKELQAENPLNRKVVAPINTSDQTT